MLEHLAMCGHSGGGRVHNELSNLNGQMMIRMVILIISMCKLCRFAAPGLKLGEQSRDTDSAPLGL